MIDWVGARKLVEHQVGRRGGEVVEVEGCCCFWLVVLQVVYGMGDPRVISKARPAGRIGVQAACVCSASRAGGSPASRFRSFTDAPPWSAPLPNLTPLRSSSAS